MSQTEEDRLRKQRNDASRDHAIHHTEPWGGEELDQLCANWDGTDDTLEVIAFVLGRTIEGCRQRYYEHVHGATEAIRAQQTRQNGDVVPTFRPGWLFGWCSGCRKTRDVYMDQHGVKLCEDCDEVELQ